MKTKKKKFVVTEIWVRQVLVKGESEEEVLNSYNLTGTNLKLANFYAIEVCD